jgi:hypothetical protein
MSIYFRGMLGISLCIATLSVYAAECDTAVDFINGYYESLNNNHVKEVLDKWYAPKKPDELRRSASNTELARVETVKLKSCSQGKTAKVYVEVVVKTNKKPAERWKGEVKLLDSDEAWKIDTMDLKKVPGKVEEEPGC